MQFQSLFLIIPILAVGMMLGISFAIVGTGNRKAWMLVVPVIAAVWIAVQQCILRVSGSEMLAMFWGLGLPAVLCVTACYFRRWRERQQ